MENFNKIWRAFFAAGIIAIAVQQLYCGDLRPVIIPEGWPPMRQQSREIINWFASILLIASGVFILLEIKARPVALALGTFLLLLFVALQVPYTFTHYPAHVGSWINPFKTFALSGGAFIVATSFPAGDHESALTKILGKLAPFGKCFMALMLILFGWSHFVYPDFCAALIPNWIPWHYFWMYLAGTALMLSGIAILINVQRRTAAALLGLMLFLWVLLLHLPRAIADPHSGHGNEWTSVFEALAFSGMAFIIAGKSISTKK